MEEIENKKETQEIKAKECNSSFTKKIRENPWIISTLILGVFVLVIISTSFSGNVTGNVISVDDAGEKFNSFLEAQQVPGAEIGDVSSVGNNLYVSNISVQGQVIPLYLTKDGEYLVQGAIPMSEIIGETEENPNTDSENSNQDASQDVPKSDKPEVELFIMTHCPYGTQAEKGIIPVFELLGNEIDSNINFVHYFMHGDIEEEETYRQICIREEQSDKYLDYLKCFLEGDGNADSSGYIANGNDPQTCIEETGIDETGLNECISERAEDYYAEESELSEGYGVQGSPTLVINGKQVSSSRSPSAYLETICNSFNEAPELCQEELSSASPSPGFGWSGTGSSTTAEC
jgi:protein-disulfide isomerase